MDTLCIKMTSKYKDIFIFNSSLSSFDEDDKQKLLVFNTACHGRNYWCAPLTPWRTNSKQDVTESYAMNNS